MLTWLLAGMAAGSPSPLQAVDPYLEWHCSENNAWQLGDGQPLVTVPAGTPWERVDRASTATIDVGGVQEAADTALVYIAPDTPTATVADALASLADAPPGYRLVLMAGPSLPGPPEASAEVARHRQTWLGLMKGEDAATALWSSYARDQPRCAGAARPVLEGLTCEAHQRALLKALATRRCQRDASLLLGLFSATWDPDPPGPPVVGVQLYQEGLVLTGQGTWETDGPRFVARMDAAMRAPPDRFAPRETALHPAIVMKLHESGALGGVVGGAPTDPVGPGAIKFVPVSELEPRRLRDPEFPALAREAGLGETTCRVDVRISRKGVPQDAKVSRCDARFHGSARTAALGSRWYPARDGDTAVMVRTLLELRFRP